MHWKSLVATLAASTLAVGLLASPALARVDPDVVHGEPGPSSEFDFLVALGDRADYRDYGMEKAQFCGGTLVSATLVVTAAHCVYDTRASTLVVGSPGPDGDLGGPGMLVKDVTSIKINPTYRPGSESGDIAVLTLTTPFRGVATVLPVTAAEAVTLTAALAPVTVAGWGATNERDPWRYPTIYNIGDLVVFPDSACGGGQDFTLDGIRFDGYNSLEVNKRTMLCAEGVRNDRIVDSCVGDSGGPLVGGADADRRLVGIVSWGPEECATRQGAGVYTRVSAFTDFLKSAGVPFAPTPEDGPEPPRISRVTTTATSITATVSPSTLGTQPDSYSVSARDSDGIITSCGMAAPLRPATAACTIRGLTAGSTYTLTAIAIAGDAVSEPSDPRTVSPAGLPARPRITYYKAQRGGFAGFAVERISGNGSVITKRKVVCSTSLWPTRQATIDRQGIAVVTGLKAGKEYSCVAIVANAYGSSRSRPVALTAK